jgi:hypothetical protein
MKKKLNSRIKKMIIMIKKVIEILQVMKLIVKKTKKKLKSRIKMKTRMIMIKV